MKALEKQREQVEFFKYPDLDSMEFSARSSGFRIIAGKQKIVVYDTIKEYQELLDVVTDRVKPVSG
ncbi:MAG: hypothetical protein GY820_47585 [Gammaproteobacteria bacterium]|nr:hypothetical protein [Gammaproteobacteria bacterium]